LSCFRIDAINRWLEFRLRLEAFIVSQNPVHGVSKPDRAIWMHHDIVGRIQPLALEFIGDHGYGPAIFVARDAASAMLAGKLAALKIEGVAVAISRGTAEHADAIVLFPPPHLHVIRTDAHNH